MRRTFWPNRIFQPSRSQNRSAGLKFTRIRENSRLSMKIVQNVLFRPCGGCFDQIAFFNLPVSKIALRDWNSRQYVTTIGFLRKFYKTCFSGHAQDVLAKSHFLTFHDQKLLIGVNFRGLKLTPIRENSRLSMKIVQNVLFRPCGGHFDQIAFLNVSEPKIALRDWNSRQYVNCTRRAFQAMRRTFWPNRIFQRSRSKNRFAAFYENCTKRTFQAMRRTFWPNRISQRFRARNRSAVQKFTPIRENSKLCMKIVQNVLFRPCGERFGQIAFFKVLDAKIALPDWNSRQYVKAVGLPWKLYKTCF